MAFSYRPSREKLPIIGNDRSEKPVRSVCLLLLEVVLSFGCNDMYCWNNSLMMASDDVVDTVGTNVTSELMFD